MPVHEHLQLRLKNCIQTVLELEPDMEKLALCDAFKEDMHFLKGCLNDIDRMSLSEQEVQRLEKATARFLRELWTPLRGEYIQKNTARVVQ